MSGKVGVIGTGAAGLSAAAHLAREGFEVLGFERSEALGGLLHPFTRDGFEFAPGLHYVGQCGPGEMFTRELERLNIDAGTIFAPMDDDFDVYRFPDFEIRMCKGIDAYRTRLEAEFPNDLRGVDRVMSAVQHLINAQGLGRPGHHAIPEYFDALGVVSLVRWMHSTFGQFLDWACEDSRLKSVFAAACGDYGLPPSKAAAGFGLAVLAHYTNGAYFPRGGAGALRDALLGAAQRHEAQFQTNAAVTRILVSDGRVVGLELEDGTHHEVDAIVAAIDPRLVYQMLPAEDVPTSVAARLPRVESSVSACVLYLGLGTDLRERGWGAFNVWDYPTWDIDAMYAPILAGTEPDEIGFFLSPNSLKDPTGSMAPEGNTTMEVLTFWPFESFARWEHTPASERNGQLNEQTERVRRRIVGALERRYPELTTNVVVSTFATPLAFQHFVNAVDGGLYGPALTPEQSLERRFSFGSEVEGLTLAGQGVMGSGVLTAVTSGRIAARITAKALS